MIDHWIVLLSTSLLVGYTSAIIGRPKVEPHHVAVLVATILLGIVTDLQFIVAQLK